MRIFAIVLSAIGILMVLFALLMLYGSEGVGYVSALMWLGQGLVLIALAAILYVVVCAVEEWRTANQVRRNIPADRVVRSSSWPSRGERE